MSILWGIVRPIALSSGLGEGLQRGFIAIPNIRITSESIRIRVLPEALERPATGDSADRSAVSSQR